MDSQQEVTDEEGNRCTGFPEEEEEQRKNRQVEHEGKNLSWQVSKTSVLYNFNH